MITETMLTIAEAAEATGLTHKAIRNRLDRGQIECVLQNGVRRIPRSELLRIGLLSGPSTHPASLNEAVTKARLPRSSLRSGGPPRGELDALVDRLHDRLEQQAIELGRARLVAEQHQTTANEDLALLHSTVGALEIELRVTKAELANVELRLNHLESAVKEEYTGGRRRHFWKRRGKHQDGRGASKTSDSST
mgnify:CR=1 FL=1